MSFARTHIHLKPIHTFRPGTVAFLILLFIASYSHSMLLIPMDDSQTDHLKAYGLTFAMLKAGAKVYWLLNYKCGSFATDDSREFELKARLAGVEIQRISTEEWAGILDVIENSNMEKVTLEKAPRIAVYKSPFSLPWDDAVVLALEYADIPFDKVYDKEVLAGKLSEYDWLHLHHEDFTGQYS